MATPIEQFELKTLAPFELFGTNLAFSNCALFMVVGVVFILGFLRFATRSRALVPGGAQSVAEIIYSFIDGMIMTNIGKAGKPFFPFIFSIFVFILAGNLIGIIPYTFTYTSHASIVGGIAVLAFAVNVGVGIWKKGWGFLRTFLPSGTPLMTVPVIVPIEIISYLSKPFSLTVRLVANMMVGHIMLKVVAGFIVALGLKGGFVPMAFVGLLLIFELGIAFLQAYIFTVLSCIYLGDAVHDH